MVLVAGLYIKTRGARTNTDGEKPRLVRLRELAMVRRAYRRRPWLSSGMGRAKHKLLCEHRHEHLECDADQSHITVKMI